MLKIVAPNSNCFKAFISCLLEVPLDSVDSLSTRHDNWRERTEEFLAERGYFLFEFVPHPWMGTAIPEGAIVGVHTNGKEAPHILFARTIRNGREIAFEVEHDPSCAMKAGMPIQPTRIVLLCKLDK